MTASDVVAYHRDCAMACRQSAAIAQAGYNAGCDDAFYAMNGWLKMAVDHDRMADAVELHTATTPEPGKGLPASGPRGSV